MELNENEARLRRRGLGLAAISYDSVETLAHFSQRRSIRYPLLSDADSKLIAAFGILNESVPKNSQFHGVPHPVTYIVDAKGRIVSRNFEEDFRKRLTVGTILNDPVEPSGAAFRNEKLSLNTSATDQTVRGGERIRLFLDVRLPAKMHVYAPGVQGYIPVSWTMKPTPAAEVEGVQAPPARQMHLKAIGETVPVLVKDFRLYRDVVIGASKDVEKALTAGKELVLEGEFRYQACDDRKCYVPETVPVRWLLRYEPHDSTRVPAELRRVK